MLQNSSSTIGFSSRARLQPWVEILQESFWTDLFVLLFAVMRRSPDYLSGELHCRGLT